MDLPTQKWVNYLFMRVGEETFINLYIIYIIMPKKENPFTLKILLIKKVKEVIKNNKGIQADNLIAKLNVNEPFLSEKMAFTIVKNLHKDGQIIINEKDEVFFNADD